MPTIKRILFPVDFSGKCLGAARFVEAFARRFGAEVLLLHVVTSGEHNLAEELFPMRQAQLATFFPDGLSYISTERCVLGEDPSTAILEADRTWKPDLIMMPTGGLGAFERLLVGSVTAEMLRGAACPVWTGVHAETAPQPEEIHCRRVLCAVGMSEHSQAVLEWAAWLAGQCDARLAIVHATAEITASFDGGSVEEELRQKISSDARMRMEALQLAAGTASEVFFQSGVPADIVAQVAAKFSADLLVVGRHEESGWDVLQDAYAVLRTSPCPVISF